MSDKEVSISEAMLLKSPLLGLAPLRSVSWAPTFTWVGSIAVASDMINRPHEDYPARVMRTSEQIRLIGGYRGWSLNLLRMVHQNVFGDEVFGGRWREVRVRVGHHVPPGPEKVGGLMNDLEIRYESIFDVDVLTAFYKDFETIHPFQDGNGRVGGIIVAAISHEIDPDKGWLSPNQ
jgi:hypothetical protein